MRPTILHIGGVLYWTIQTRNPDTQVLKDADATPSVAVRKNGSPVADSVTITKRSATTGLYDCSYNPAAEVEGDTFQFEERAQITGTTTSQQYYDNQFSVRAVHAGAVELDSASVTAVQSGLATSASITALRGADNDTLKTLSDQIDGIDGGTGLTGPYTRTITVTDADTHATIEAAKVRLYRTGETETKPTNASGVASFTTEAATFSYAVTANGYGGASGTIAISANGTTTIELTAISVTPGTGNITTGYLTCLDEEGAAEEGVSVRCQMVQVPASGTGIAYDSAVQLATSGADGLVEFSMIKGARYLVWRGSIKPPQGLAPTLISASAGTTTALGSLIGFD